MANDSYQLHPAQLKTLQVLKLGIEVHKPELALHEDFELGEFSIENGRSEFDPESSTINVRMRIRAGRYAIDEDAPSAKDEEFREQPVSFVVEVGGIFNVDISTFPQDKVHHWAETNAPLILYPYVREQVYGLSSRVGIKQIILPLLEVPTIKVVKKET